MYESPHRSPRDRTSATSPKGTSHYGSFAAPEIAPSAIQVVADDEGKRLKGHIGFSTWLAK